MNPNQIFKQIRFLYLIITAALIIFSVIAIIFVSNNGKLYELTSATENNLKSLLLLLSLAGIPASFMFHSHKVKHIDKQLNTPQKLFRFKTGFFIKIITLEGLSIISLLAYIMTGQLNYLSIFGIIYLALLISYPVKTSILNELDIDPSEMSHSSHQP